MKKVTYFDLGVHQGQEIDYFIEIANELNFEYKIIGLEADPILFHELLFKYHDNKSIQIINVAASSRIGIEKLYQSAEGGIGNSIFSTKNNVNPNNYYYVLGIEFSSLLTKENLGDINILRFNIEGAELFLMQDIINKYKAGVIDIFCGSTPDIEKVASITHLKGFYDKLLLENNIHVFEFYHTPFNNEMQKMIINFKNNIKSLL